MPYQCNHRILHRIQILNQLPIFPFANWPPIKMQQQTNTYCIKMGFENQVNLQFLHREPNISDSSNNNTFSRTHVTILRKISKQDIIQRPKETTIIWNDKYHSRTENILNTKADYELIVSKVHSKIHRYKFKTKRKKLTFLTFVRFAGWYDVNQHRRNLFYFRRKKNKQVR